MSAASNMIAVIKEQKASSVVASSEQANYPATNLLDEWPKNISKAAEGVPSVVYTFNIASNSDALQLIGTNAETAVLELDDPNALDCWDGIENSEWDGLEWETYAESISDSVSLDGISGSAWFDWPCTLSTMVGSLTLTAPYGKTLFSGTLWAGKKSECGTLLWGVGLSLDDRSIVNEMPDKSKHIIDGDRPRVFDCSHFMRSDAELYDFMLNTAQQIGEHSRPWKLTGLDSFWVLFAGFNGMPNSTFQHSDCIHGSFKLIEQPGWKEE